MNLLSILTTAKDLLLVVLGFSLIIVIHELGHFLAARWAGIRVLGFAVGFGPALVSWRKGLGLRRGSSEGEVGALKKTAAAGDDRAAERLRSISPTEYRWNILPLGGYVKMLGQDDSDPTAVSDEPDSYNRCPPAKRMVVISAGVIMNVIAAAVLFVIVFRTGLSAEAAVVGAVRDGSPAALAVPVNAAELKITDAGIRPGDRIVSVNGVETPAFMHVGTNTAMAGAGKALEIVVKRPGIEQAVRFAIEPKPDPTSGLLSIGVGPAPSNRLLDGRADPEGDRAELNAAGFADFPLGSTLKRLTIEGGATIEVIGAWQLDEAARLSNGRTVTAEFVRPDGKPAGVAFAPILLTTSFFEAEGAASGSKSSVRRIVSVDHALGLAPTMGVRRVNAGSLAEKGGLMAGDIFALLGEIQWPSFGEGQAQIRKHAGKRIDVVVWRKAEDGTRTLVKLPDVNVDKEGRIGFLLTSTVEAVQNGPALVASWPVLNMLESETDTTVRKLAPEAPSGSRKIPPGSIITAVNGVKVRTLAEATALLRTAAESMPADAKEPIVMRIAFSRILDGAPAAETAAEWKVPAIEARAFAAAPWRSPISIGLFEPEMTLLQADSFTGAIAMGVRETHRAMLQTYQTFARLFQGSVKIEHLRGPVGIAHTGTLLAEKGFIWLLFFMAVISVNLAVINFLPLPIVDGGHFVFLLYEQFTGKPVSVAVQNIATICGLLMIGSLFLIVTYHDITRILGL